METKRWPKEIKAFIIIIGIFFVLIIGYLLLNAFANKKVAAALKQLPSGIHLSYSSLQTSLIGSSIIINDVIIKYLPEKNEQHQHYLSFDRVAFGGINFFKLLSSKKLIIEKINLEKGEISLDRVLLDKKTPMPDMRAPFEGISIDEIDLTDMNASVHTGQQEDLLLQGNLTVQAIRIDSLNKSFEEKNFQFAAVRCFASNIKYIVPDAYESLHISGFELDSKKSSLHIDTCRIVPLLNKLQMGEKKGQQVDYIQSTSSGIDMEKLDVMQLIHKKLIAEKINVRQNNIYAFRDRRLPLHADIKPMPVDYFKTMPFSMRVQSVMIGATTFVYEEFPKEGKETGILKILRLHVSIAPFISHPVSTDPAFMNMKVEGSLMGSGTVNAVVQLPLRKENDYLVEGAFHDLDLTTLNASAENLGKIHIESGMLNSLAFQFNLNEEKSTGKIIGEYHNLVIDKLKEKSDDKKVDRFKSFFVKTFIIRKDKDKTLAEAKRTGKVDYKRDPTRYFSFYLLHSLLTGVKASFSLGFLLPG